MFEELAKAEGCSSYKQIKDRELRVTLDNITYVLDETYLDHGKLARYTAIGDVLYVSKV